MKKISTMLAILLSVMLLCMSGCGEKNSEESGKALTREQYAEALAATSAIIKNAVPKTQQMSLEFHELERDDGTMQAVSLIVLFFSKVISNEKYVLGEHTVKFTMTDGGQQGKIYAKVISNKEGINLFMTPLSGNETDLHNTQYWFDMKVKYDFETKKALYFDWRDIYPNYMDGKDSYGWQKFDGKIITRLVKNEQDEEYQSFCDRVKNDWDAFIDAGWVDLQADFTEEFEAAKTELSII